MVARIVTLTNHLGTSQLPCWLPQVRYRLDNGGQHSSCRPAQQAEPSCQLPGEVQAVTAARLCVVYTKCHSLLTSGQGWNYIIKVLKILQSNFKIPRENHSYLKKITLNEDKLLTLSKFDNYNLLINSLLPYLKYSLILGCRSATFPAVWGM